MVQIGLLKDIVKTCTAGKALLGMDVGKKTIGLALSDPEKRVATPLKTVTRGKFQKDAEIIAEIMCTHEIGGCILGLPLHMDGSEGRRAQSVRDFAAELVRVPAVANQLTWLAFWDERLSTDTVEGFVDKYVEKRKTKEKSKSSGLIDRLAAQLILREALEYINKNI